MAINLVKSKVKELEELYSYLLTKYLESKGKGQTLTSLYNGVSKLEQVVSKNVLLYSTTQIMMLSS